MSDEKPIYDGWAILELMGHVRLAGRVTEESHFGVALGRIDIPSADGYTTQYFGGSSIYRLTPTTEAIARSVASTCCSVGCLMPWRCSAAVALRFWSSLQVGVKARPSACDW